VQTCSYKETSKCYTNYNHNMHAVRSQTLTKQHIETTVVIHFKTQQSNA